MQTSLWRSIHGILACLVSLFLIIASVTGGILAFNQFWESTHTPHRIGQETLSELVPKIQNQLSEISELEVVHQQIIVKGFDDEMNEVTAVVEPSTGQLMGAPTSPPEWIKTVTTLHRSLFLHEMGRSIVGGVSVLFLFSLLSGFILLYIRQGRRWLSNSEMRNKADFIHFLGGKWFSLPLMIIALTGSILFLFRLGWLEEKETPTIALSAQHTKKIDIQDFPIFKNTPVKEVQKLTFPLFEDEEEFFELTTLTQKLKINQQTGDVISRQEFPATHHLSYYNKAIHTGEIHWAWALVLFLSSWIILLMVSSGVWLWLNRRPQHLKNQYTAEEAEYIILVGSEGGTTWAFAEKIYQQLLNLKQKVFLAYLNDFQSFPKAKYLIIFTSTYGDGDAPHHAEKAFNLIKNTAQQSPIQYTVLGFGSKSYPNFCGFAKDLDQCLAEMPWAEPLLPLHTVNDRSLEEIAQWATAWNEKHRLQLMSNPMYYHLNIVPTETLTVINKSDLDTENQTFSIVFKTSYQDFSSGDILAIYPENNEKERLYSIGKVGQDLHLMVKLHPHGLGSQFLHQLTVGTQLKGRIIKNPYFHLPAQAPAVLMIANGTGIAPFLGMIRNATPVKKYLYAGFRHRTTATINIEKEALNFAQHHHIQEVKTGYSQSETPQYVTDLVRENIATVASILRNQGVVMICGALAMQKDVEALLDTLLPHYQLHSVAYYKEQHQILTDCY